MHIEGNGETGCSKTLMARVTFGGMRRTPFVPPCVTRCLGGPHNAGGGTTMEHNHTETAKRGRRSSPYPSITGTRHLPKAPRGSTAGHRGPPQSTSTLPGKLGAKTLPSSAALDPVVKVVPPPGNPMQAGKLGANIGSLGYVLPLMAATGDIDAPREVWGAFRRLPC